MRKVIATAFLSLDGVAEQPIAFASDWDGEIDEDERRIIRTQDAVLLGRRTYDEWAEFWPTSEIEPFASFINGVDKFVATSTPLSAPWENSREINGDLATFVTTLKEREGGDIGVHGSISVTQALLEAGLVDELRLAIAPVVAVHGRKLFDIALERRLTLTRHATTPAGYLVVDYRVDS